MWLMILRLLERVSRLSQELVLQKVSLRTTAEYIVWLKIEFWYSSSFHCVKSVKSIVILSNIDQKTLPSHGLKS